MKRADELWEDFQYNGWIGQTSFKAALKEYGAEVRKADVTKCRLFSHRRDDMGAIIAAEIEQEPLP